MKQTNQINICYGNKKLNRAFPQNILLSLCLSTWRRASHHIFTWHVKCAPSTSLFRVTIIVSHFATEFVSSLISAILFKQIFSPPLRFSHTFWELNLAKGTKSDVVTLRRPVSVNFFVPLVTNEQGLEDWRSCGEVFVYLASFCERIIRCKVDEVSA